MKEKTIVLNKSRDVTLTPYIVTQDKKLSFLIAPGGGYTTCDESEGEPVARTFNDLGYNAYILRYSVGKNYKWPYPLDDFDQAMDYLDRHQDVFQIDTGRIVAAGFSAGGHLVSVAASQAKKRPFAAVICYGLTSRETLSYCAPDAPDACDVVSLDTSPCFLASSRNDWIVPIGNTTRLIDAFQKNFIDYEAHIYGYALHGFSVGERTGAVGPLFCSRSANWVKDSLEWLDELVTGRYMSIKECAEYNDAYATHYSSMNSCKLIFETKAAQKIVKYKFPTQYLLYTAAQKQIGAFMDTVSLRNLLQLLKVDEKTIAKIDMSLSNLPIERNVL